MTDSVRQQINLLYGHIYFGKHKQLNGESKYITFLRNPVDRIVSYYYAASTPSHRNYEIITKNKLSIFEFISTINEPDLHNAQTRLISGITCYGENILKKALENIEDYFPVVDLLEKYNESLLLIASTFNFRFPYYVTQNINKNRKKTQEIDEKTLTTIKKQNNDDMLLYERCKNDSMNN